MNESLRHIRISAVATARGDLKTAAQLRQTLVIRLHIEREKPSTRIKRDVFGKIYFDFATYYPKKIDEILLEFGHFFIAKDLGEVGMSCTRCGFLAGFVTACPECNLRDIDPCPGCHAEIARENYISLASDYFLCPKCKKQVKFSFNDNPDDSHGVVKVT